MIVGSAAAIVPFSTSVFSANFREDRRGLTTQIGERTIAAEIEFIGNIS
jgi:hypothetical protein